MWLKLARALFLASLVCGAIASTQESTPPKPPDQKSEPQYEDTFSGAIVQLSSDKIVVSRSILGQEAENRTFWVKADTKIEGKLKVKVKVTIGFVTSDEGDVAKLIVVRGQQPKK